MTNSANQGSSITSSASNGQSALHDLFALTDEQILEIEPEAQEAIVSRDPWPVTREEKSSALSRAANEPALTETVQGAVAEKPTVDSHATASNSSTEHGTRDTGHVQDPPPWLAAQMKDPWTGEEARELWNGVQQAKSAAAYRAAFANPEDARALKELYPGGVNEARAAAERARVLDDIDHAYFGAPGKSAQEVSVSRAQLAQTMLRENPAAFREMVFAGLRALEEPGAQTGSNAGSRFSATSAAESTAAQTVVSAAQTQGGLKSPPDASAQAQADKRATDNEARLAAYASFEKAANEDLERSIGGAIERALNQALPNVGRITQDASSQAGQAPPLQARLSAAIRQDVEAALKGDRQLGEQVAQILSGRRLDDETRRQVVRLIGERAQQLVPVAAKRVLNDWTQTTLSAHRSKSTRADAASTRREVAPVSGEPSRNRMGNTVAATPSPGRSDARKASAGRVDYRKLSDEQILDL